MAAGGSIFALGRFELIAAYVLLAALLLSLNLWARLGWWIKALAIVLTTAFFFVSFVSVKHLLGWPTEDLLPDRFELVYAVINEPDEATRTPGAIYIWAMALPGEGPVDEADVYTPGVIDTRLKPGQVPRAYALPYDRETHKKVHEAWIKTIDGVRQVGVTTRKPKKPGEHAPQSQYAFYDRPDPILPPKGAPPEVAAQ